MENNKNITTYTVEQLRTLPEDVKIQILSVLEPCARQLNTDHKKSAEHLSHLLSGNVAFLMKEGYTDFSTDVSIGSIVQKLPYPTRDTLTRILEKNIPNK